MVLPVYFITQLFTKATKIKVNRMDSSVCLEGMDSSVCLEEMDTSVCLEGVNSSVHLEGWIAQCER